MKLQYLLLALLLQSICAHSKAQNLGLERTGTVYTYVYRIPAAMAQQALNGKLNPNEVLNYPCVDSFYTDSAYTRPLVVGHYLLINTVQDKLNAKYLNVTDIATTALPDYNHVKMVVLQHSTGVPLTNAVIEVGHRSYLYDTASHAYIMPYHGQSAFVTVRTPTDTLFYNLSNTSYPRRHLQWSDLSWKFHSFGRRIQMRFRWWFGLVPKRYPGYVVTSKPKYYPNDTVKVKAFITRPNGKPFNKPLTMHVQRSDRSWRTLCDTLKPVSPGAYVYSFALNDSFAADKYYDLDFVRGKGLHNRTIISSGFKVEDYLLNVNTYEASTEKEDYNVTDTLRVNVAGHDFNGLPVLDATVKIAAVTEDITSFSADRVFIPDTIFAATGQLDGTGNFKYPFILVTMPKAAFMMHIYAHVANGNNEIWDTSFTVNYNYQSFSVLCKQHDDSISATYYINGLPATGKGRVIISGKGSKRISILPVSFPCTLAVNPAAMEYWFSDDSGRADKHEEVSESSDWQGTAYHTDSLVVFIISNKDRIPFLYTIFRNGVVIEKGQSTALYRTIPDRSDAIYSASIQYEHRGETKSETYRTVRQKNTLQIGVTGADQVYPGQRDSLNIQVKNYNGKPVKNVNLTAYSANAQFGDLLKLPQLPGHYRRHRLNLRMYQPTLNMPEYTGSFQLCCVPAWRQRLRLDSMPYYQMTFPQKLCSYYYDTLPYHTPQMAVYVYRCGRQVKIYNVHLDGQLMYTSENELPTPYSFEGGEGLHTLSFRLNDREIAFKGLKLYAGYKSEISYNYDSLLRLFPKSNRKAEYTSAEISELRLHTIGYNCSYADYNGNNFLWQGNRVFHVPSGNSGRLIAGPIKSDSIVFYRYSEYTLTFMPEEDYAYSFSKSTERLERFEPYNYTKLIESKNGRYKLGLRYFHEPDPKPFGEICRYPELYTYKAPVYKAQRFRFDYIGYGKQSGYGILQIEPRTDSAFEWLQLTRTDTAGGALLDGSFRKLHLLQPGVYSVMLVTASGNYVYFDSLTVKPNGLNYAVLKPCRFKKLAMLGNTGFAIHADTLINGWGQQPVDTAVYGNGFITGNITRMQSTSSTPAGNVKSIHGLPVHYAIVRLSKNGKLLATTHADADGNFVFAIKTTGPFDVSAFAEDYEERQVTGVQLTTGYVTVVYIGLKPSVGNLLSEVDITSGKYEQHLSEQTVSMEVIRGDNIASMPGVMMNDGFANQRFDKSLAITKVSESKELNEVQVVNGYSKDKRTYTFELNPEATEEKVVTDSTVVISDKLKNKYAGAKTLRTNFKDEGFWQPNLVTDKAGQALFAVQYPDNLTAWRAYVIGMDGHRRTGAAVKTVRSFKDVSATLATPGFLIEGDSANLVGEAYNYTHTPLNFAATYTVGATPVFTRNIPVTAATDLQLPIVAPPFKGPADTITATYSIALSNGYADGEERKIPVLERGTTETKGIFAVLKADTTFDFIPDTAASAVTIYAEGDLLPVMLKEIEHLKQYPYWCVEQTASRLVALTTEQKIDSALGIKFKGDAEKKSVIKKLLAMQLYNGAFGWWKDCAPDIYITNYVLSALNNANAGNNYTVTNARNSATTFLQQTLPYMNREETLNTLETLSANPELKDYLTPLLKRIPFDSISLQQQLRLHKAELKCGIQNPAQWNALLRHKQETVFDGAYFGEETYCFYNNVTEATLIAYDIAGLQSNTTLQQQIISYLLTTRTANGWRNTYESARILETILPQIIKERGGTVGTARLTINGAVATLPYKGAYGKQQPVHIGKQGKAPVYFTVYQKIFNHNPAPVSTLYTVRTNFKSNNQYIDTLKGGVVTQLEVNIDAKKLGEYISIEVPIPAGCTYNSKDQPYGNSEIHREYYKNKVLIFCRNLTPGPHTFYIMLQPRYTGIYTLNPTRVELMYFPTMYGRNGIRKVKIGE